MPDERIACFIDGGALDKILERLFDFARIDYMALAREMSLGKDCLRTYYYHCKPYVSNPATPDEIDRQSKKDRFFHKLSGFDRFSVKLGRLEYRGEDVSGKKLFLQKRVDTQLVVDLITLCHERSITHASILTGDSDFLPVIEAAQALGVQVILFHATNYDFYHIDLWRACDIKVPITQQLINSILR